MNDAEAVALIEALAKTEAAEHHCTFIFLDVNVLLASPYAKPGAVMPQYNELRRTHPNMFVERRITFSEVCSGRFVDEWLTVSHRWMARHEPDADGTQLKVVKAHVRAHRASIKLVWYDAWCLPRRPTHGARILRACIPRTTAPR